MKSSVYDEAPAAPPPQRVHLDLSVAEFATLYLLMFRGLSGTGAHRANIENGMLAAYAKLNHKNAAMVDDVTSTENRPSTVTETICTVFGRA